MASRLPRSTRPVATACGSSDSTSEALTGVGERPTSFEDLEQQSPLGDFLGFSFGQDDEMNERFEEMGREAGRITQQCMAEQGFEYIPENEAIISFNDTVDELPYFSDEWVAKYGFGISTQRFPQSMVGDLVGFDGPDFFSNPQEFTDPNEEYVSSLSPGEAEAYYEALYGFSQGSPFDVVEEDDFDFEPSGCQSEGFDAAFDDGPIGDIDNFFTEFSGAMEDLDRRTLADPRVVEFNDAVGTCVSEAGLVWVDQEELWGRWESRLNEIQPQGPMVFESSDEDIETSPEQAEFSPPTLSTEVAR